MKNSEETRKCKNLHKFISNHKLLIFLITIITIVIIISISVGVFIATRPIKKRHFRLPTNLVPEHYNLEIQPYLIPDDLRFVGNVEVVFKCVEKTDEVILHSKELEIEEDALKLQDGVGNEIDILGMKYDADINFLILFLGRYLNEGDNYRLFLKFGSKFSEDANGFYISKFKDKNNRTHYTAVTQFEPISARKAFPCFDEPALKATFDITIVRWRNMSSLSNMLVTRRETRGRDWEADVYQTSMKMSTYLVAFFIGDYKGKKKDKVMIWAPPDNITSVDYALEIAPRALSFLEDLLGVPYSLSKLDMVSLTRLSASAMENWGLITYSEEDLLYDESNEGYSDKYRILSTVVHEIAHQWFGNLVTMKWWNDLWLNEGISTYMEDIVIGSLFPELRENDTSRKWQQLLLNFLECSWPHTTPVAKTVDTFEDLEDESLFDMFTYEKGSLIIKMVHEFLGNETFWKGISRYLKENAFGNVNEETLWDYLTKAQPDNYHKLNLSELMGPWIHLKGQPIVSVIRNYESGTAFVEQVSCRGKLFEEHKNDMWKIPIFYTTVTNRNSSIKTWLHNKNTTLRGMPNNNEWILINEEKSGYYFVNYDRRNWQLLAEQFQRNHLIFKPVKRLLLLHDLQRLLILNYTEPVTILNFSLYVPNEEDLTVIEYSSIIDVIDTYSNYFQYDTYQSVWNEFIRYIYVPLYEKIGWDSNQTMEEDFYVGKPVAIFQSLCKINYNDCVNEAIKYFEIWKEIKSNWTTPGHSILFNLLCTGMKFGTINDSMEVYEEYKLTGRWTYLEALGCSTNEELIMRILEEVSLPFAFNFVIIAKTLISNEEMWTALFQFIDENFNKIIKDEEVFRVIQQGVFTRIKNPTKLNKLLSILRRHVKRLNRKLAEVISEAIDSIEKEVLEIKRQKRGITEWILQKPWTKRIR